MDKEQGKRGWDAIFSSINWRPDVMEDQLEDSKRILKRLEESVLTENSSPLLKKEKKTS